MNDPEINVIIAEACGWEIENYGPKGYESLYWRLRKPNGEVIRNTEECTGEEWSRTIFSHLVPRYTKDLNAMHEAENVLTDRNQRYQYFYVELPRFWNPRQHSELETVASATARQRAEAFLRTLGKWKEITASEPSNGSDIPPGDSSSPG